MTCVTEGGRGARGAPNIKGTPYKYHVYLASCPADQEFSRNVRNHLEQRGLSVSPNEDITREIIELRMLYSWKILFLATPSYTIRVPCNCEGLEEAAPNAAINIWRTLEVSVARDKANSLGDDYVIVLQSPYVNAERLRNVGLSFHRSIPQNLDILQYFVEAEPAPSRVVRENMGAALAYAHFHGYIKIIIPGLRERLHGEINIEGSNLNDRVMSSQFFVIIPYSGRGMPSLSDDNADIEDRKVIIYKGARGSNALRDYSSCIHKIINRGAGNKELFFVGEIPAILVNLYDMREQMSSYRRRIETCQFYHHLKELLTDDVECRGRVTFIFHEDYGSGCAPLTDILLDEIRIAIEAEKRQQLNIDASGGAGATANEHQQVRSRDSFREVETGPLRVMYVTEPLAFYQMDRKPVGKALIINNRNFEGGLTERTGSEVDEEMVVELLKWLNFEHILMRDQSVHQMMALADAFATDACQESAQAFVCVIMSHGQSGQIYGRDGQLLNFVDFAEIIGRCSELRNKPKLFFVLTPQTADMASLGVTSHDGDGLSRLTVSVRDCLCSFATLQGEDCRKPAKDGSPYIRALDTRIRQQYAEKHLEEILKHVIEDVQEAASETPFHVTSLNKRVALHQ